MRHRQRPTIPPTGASAVQNLAHEHGARHYGETANQRSVPAEILRTGEALREESAERISFYFLLVPFAILLIAILLLSRYKLPTRAQVVVSGGDVEEGRSALRTWGCGACHTIPGVAGAYGKVGPSLEEIASHSFIAGELVNTPENMVRWIMVPQEISPGNAMPDTGVPENLARDMAAYLYLLK